jgi:polysaccharide deacetylase 2 family uncharacterized protein YibQ
MAELKARDLLFLDSLTSPKSVAYATAKEFGVKAAKRDVFLDNESDNAEYIHGQLEELTRMAKERGWAIGIGHPHPATINALRTWIAEANRQGIMIVPLSRLISKFRARYKRRAKILFQASRPLPFASPQHRPLKLCLPWE